MHYNKKRLSWLLALVILMTCVPASFTGAIAETTLTLMSDPYQVLSDTFTVRFFERGENGAQVLYQEDGFTNPQTITAGELPVMPSGKPDAYPGYQFTGWDEGSTKPVKGETDIYALYSPLNTVSNMVEFVRDDGGFVGGTYYALVKEGEPLKVSVPAPSLEGSTPAEEGPVAGFAFTPDGKGGGTVEINIEHAADDQVYRIVYQRPPDVAYTVDHYIETSAGKYTLDSSDPYTGTPGAIARPKAKAIDGYTLTTDLTTITDRIAADGTTHVRLEYKRNQYSVYYDPGVMGTLPQGQKERILLYTGDKIPTNIGTPERLGYTFTGWAVEDGLTAMPAHDITVTATWKAGQANYMVVVWGQEADKNASGQYGYAIMDTIQSSGAVDSVATYNNQKRYEYFSYERTEQNIRIKPDGSTVLNVYYTRNTYTITFMDRGQTLYVLKAKFQEDVTSRYNAPDFPQQYRDVFWSATGIAATPLPIQMIGKNDTYMVTGVYGYNRFVIRHCIQTINANGTPNPDRSAYIPYEQYTLANDGGYGEIYVMRYRYQGYEYNYPSLGGWNYENRSLTTIYPGTTNFYYNLLSYDITFYDRGQMTKITKYYTADLTGLDQQATLSKPVAGYEDFTFDGWYETQDFTGDPYTFAGRTMPYHGLVLYAKWVAPTYNVTFVTNGGSAVDPQKVDKWAYVTEPEDPTLSDREFQGWYLDPGYGIRYLFSQAVTSDLTLFAKWSGSGGDISVTIQHQDEDGKTLAPDTQDSGTAGQTITVYPKDITGYLPTERSMDVELLNPAGETVTFTYVPMHEITYTVYYKDAADKTTDLLPPKPTTLSPSHPTAIVTATREIIPGYTPDEMQKTLHLIHPNPNEIYFYYTRNSSKTTYTVVTYLEEPQAGGFGAEPPVTKDADLGARVEEQPAPPVGYVFDEAMSTKSGNVLTDGRLQLSMYYRCETFSYDVEHIIQRTGEVVEAATRENIRYGQRIKESALDRDDLRYLSYGGEGDVGTGTDRDVVLTIKAGGVKIQFDYVKQFTITATVEGGTITPSGEIAVDAGTSKTFTYKPDDGYVFDKLLVDGVEVPDADPNEYTLKDIDKDHTVEVRFAAEQNTVTIAALDQVYIYNGAPQGVFGDNLTTGLEKLAKTTGLKAGHTLKQLTIAGTQQQDANIYTDEIVPEAAQVVDGDGKDVTDQYTIDYVKGTLTIYKKGSGEEDPDGGEKPMMITAAEQTYVYTGQPQGIFGSGLTVDGKDVLATAIQLVSGHMLKTITLTGDQESDPDTYGKRIVPTEAIIEDAGGTDVTKNYNITTASYVPGDLVILPLDSTGNVVIRAANQSYEYNGQPQGVVGDLTLTPGDPDALVTATGLLTGHRLASVTLDGELQTEVNVYTDSLKPKGAVILDGNDKDVTAFYQLKDSNYKPGTLSITKMGGGDTLRIIASDQHYTYNETAQGMFGDNLAIDNSTPLARAEGLMDGHSLAEVSLSGSQKIDPDLYDQEIMPTGAKIVDAGGNDVTDTYAFTDNTFVAGDLIIHKKGNGKPDEENGGELPMDITASDQTYIYNGRHQGKFGAYLPVDDAELGALATAIGLLDGHSLASVSLLGTPQDLPGPYPDAITPLHAKIVDSSGTDVTSKYLLSDAESYHPGTLTIYKKGNGEPDDKEGGELPLEITAEVQRYVYNGQPQGKFGDNLSNPVDDPLATAKALVPGHRLERVWLTGTAQTDPGHYPDAITPTQVRIVDGAGGDVTEHYRIETSSYHTGDLIISKKGNGTTDPDDPDGGEFPLEVYARDQYFVYNGEPQGIVGGGFDNTAIPPQMSAVGLLSGHTVSGAFLDGQQQTEVGRYEDEIVPTGLVIVDGQGNDVTDKYKLDEVSYRDHEGDLIILPKGNGIPDPDDPNGGELPLDITAANQIYVYNKAKQGLFGADLDVTASAVPLVDSVAELVRDHVLVTITLSGDQETLPDTYPGRIEPSAAVIHDADGNDVTANYRIEPGSYHAGDLIITKKGNGTTDPTDPDGGELPLEVTAADQRYVYNGQGQGHFGQALAVDPADPVATAAGLLDGDTLSTVSLLGTRRTEPDSYTGAINPLQARIVDEDGQDVTAFYRIVEDVSYHPGDLIITKKGNGITDPDDPDGAELPLDITAVAQRYVYNGEPQGRFGTDLTSNVSEPLATATQLVPGHRIKTITINGEQQTLPETYSGVLEPADVAIVDARGTDVTSFYRIEDGISYHPGDLIITKKGNGITDPDDPDGAEYPLEVRAADQTYVFSGQPQGTFGTELTVDASAPVATALELAPGHSLSKVTITGQPQTDVGVYADTIIPSAAIIVDMADNDVTAYYRIEDSVSYLPGTLEIRDDQVGTQVLITAADQHFTYNGEEQGDFGTLTISAGDAKPVARAQGLTFGHRLAGVTLNGTRQTEPQNYPGAIVPTGAVIVDGNGTDVTSQYAMDADSYRAGNLIIHPKGNGKPDPNGGEEPLDIFAEDQPYIYNGKPQGLVGDDLPNTNDPSLARAVGLLDGHSIKTVSLEGSQQTNAGRYNGTLVPTGVLIVDAQDNDVTAKYRIEKGGMHEGDLIIYPKGNGDPDPEGGEQPMVITAKDQEYIYNGRPQGIIGVDMPVQDTDPLVTVNELVGGHAVKTITILGTQKTEADVYAGSLKPMQAAIVDENGEDVTANYRITDKSYIAGTLTIYPRGNGQPDKDKGGELPMDITALRQSYVYDGNPQGLFGKELTPTPEYPLADAVSLAPGHRLSTITLAGDQQTEPGPYPEEIVPADAVIVDAGGLNVTKNYRIEDSSYHPGDLEITKKGNGTTDPTDPDGGELPLDIYAETQRFTYNGSPQGVFGEDLDNTGTQALARATGLLAGHSISTVSLTGTPETDADRYNGAITPTKVVIVDDKGNDVTAKYRIEDSSYHQGDLVILPKGNGQPDPNDPDGKELPLDITAAKQTFIYNAAQQGLLGDDLDAVQPDNTIIATANQLVTGHKLSTVSLSGTKQIEAGTYEKTIRPAGASIVDADGNDVTKNYRIEDSGYHPGDLVIYPKGNGNPDPSGGEEPLDVTAATQRYIYNGQSQGRFGAGLVVQTADGPLATADALLPEHTLSTVTLAGMQQIPADTYTDAITPLQAHIVDAGGTDVTKNYRLEEGSYHTGDLVIAPRGAGGGDDAPIQITADDQEYIYNGHPQGRYGENLTSTQSEPLAVSDDLLAGHRVQTITLEGSQKTAAGKYPGEITPSQAKIVDAGGADVTASYLVTDESYQPGMLNIFPKGNGEPDEKNGGEKPLDITARDQTFVYSGQPQGTIGDNMTESTANTLVLAIRLVPGHRVSTVSILGQQQTAVGKYPNALTPDAVKIVDGSGADVTDNYRIEAGSYHKGSLEIISDSGVTPLVITAKDQRYVYNGSPQGAFGTIQIDPQEPLATASGLLSGHRLEEMTLTGSQKTDPGPYLDLILPSDAIILDEQDNDVTSSYPDIRYVAGDLTIDKKGNGDPDPDGGEEPLDVTATDQSFVYNGKKQGAFGVDIQIDEDKPQATASGLLDGHRLNLISLTGAVQMDVGSYPDEIMPGRAQIVDADGNDVTDKYRLENEGYHPGALTILPKGNGQPDGNGGELPLDITAAGQRYVYNGQPQGVFGKDILVDSKSPEATAVALVPGQRLEMITLSGTPETEPGPYNGAIHPEAARIVNAAGEDVTHNYLIVPASYHPGDLIIDKKGNGKPDPDGGEEPLDIFTLKQSFVYDEKPHGHVGENLAITEENPLVNAVGLLPGHVLKTVTIGGDQQTEVGVYNDSLLAADIRIMDSQGRDMMDKYRIEDTSYHPGDLEITKKGNGTTDPTDPDGGELPLEIRALDQAYVYNGAEQGVFGQDLPNTGDPKLADAVGLLEGHSISVVTLTGTKQIDAQTYPGAITPSKVTIVDAQGTDVTAKYRIESTSYIPGDLIITPKGNGTTDPTDPNGGELPLEITASRQSFVYNGKKQGLFGDDLPVGRPEGPLVTAVKLIDGHSVSTVTLGGTQQTEAGTYGKTILPAGAVILDAEGSDVTKNYRIEPGSYLAGDLVITRKGNGTTDPTDPEGGELPLDVTAADQRYIYNAEPQGVFGAGLAAQSANGALATAEELVQGHTLTTITLAGMPKTDAATYTDAITPLQARIVDADGNDVSKNYRLEDKGYHAGDLVIVPRGAGGSEDTPIQITAKDQAYVYNGEPQGRFGQDLVSTETAPLATHDDLLPGHRVRTITLSGDLQSEVGTYTDTIVPSEAKIVDAAGKDVTAFYLITTASYQPGSLKILKKGNGTTDPADPDGGELPLDITALDQLFVYTGQPQGTIGDDLAVSDANPLVSTRTLVNGHRVSTVSIQGAQQTEIGEYPDSLTPGSVQIVDGDGKDVTGNYRIESDVSYHPGKLTITADSGGVPLVITAANQRYVYNGSPQGSFGTASIDALAPQATASGLLSGHRLTEITLEGTPQTEPDTYTGEIVPKDAVILDASDNDVTSRYLDIQYVAGDLIITKKGNGITDPDDPNGGELPLDVTATGQSFIYNGRKQGTFGVDIQIDQDTPQATASGLLDGHTLNLISLTGTPQMDAGTYPEAILPGRARIVDTDGNDVTDKYRLEDDGYHPGDLLIRPKGNGQPDGNGGEQPLDVTASGQHYVYNGQPQGTFGADLVVETENPLATAETLVPGQRMEAITLIGNPETEPGKYGGAIIPSEARIKDATGEDVTRNYLIAPESYHPGDLEITKKGNGTTDPADPDGGEEPLDIFTLNQSFVYNEKPQGTVGENLIITAEDPLVNAVGLIDGHSLKTVSIGGDQKTEIGVYTGALLAADVKIVDGQGRDVTDKYKIVDASYHAGDLTITKKGNGTTDPTDPDGGELPLDIYAADQAYIYNGNPQGRVGDGLSNAGDPVLATATGLLEGHTISTVSITGDQQAEAGRYEGTLVPGKVVIVDGRGKDVTDKYKIVDASYRAGDLIIFPKGNGKPDTENGGELPLDVTANKQTYVYNGDKQGLFGDDLPIAAEDGSALASVETLVKGHEVKTVSLAGSQQTEAGAYNGSIQPTGIAIVDAAGNDVTGNYRIEKEASYHAGNLIITPKGNGTTDPTDPDGGELPLDVTAANQRYIYNGRKQGSFGARLPVGTSDAAIATARALVEGHTLATVTLTGMPQEKAGTYQSEITPLQARIVDADGNDVTANYRLEDESYHAGDLVITPRGAEGGEDAPIRITATDQEYVYNGTPQGSFGTALSSTTEKPLAVSDDLVPGHRIDLVTLTGDAKTAADVYEDAILPSNARIVNAAGEDVTDCYLITPEGYLPGTLTIYHKGNGEPDTENGGELPLDITALTQTFLYTGEPQGTIGDDLPVSETTPLVSVKALAAEHRVSTVSILGEQQAQVGEYPDALTPSNVVILDGAGVDVTENYRIEAGSYRKGKLVILKDDEAAPLVITAANQSYVYNGGAQGRFGAIVIDKGQPLATAEGLLQGHSLARVTLAGSGQAEPGTYTDAITPSAAVILDEQGNDVTARYIPADIQYVAGDLVITKKGNGITDPDDPNGGEAPLDVTATDQSYIYNGAAQGIFGADVQIEEEDPLATAIGLLSGHRLEHVSLTGTQQTNADTYEGAIVPGRAKIVDADGNDVTNKYRLEDSGYHAGTLTIMPKGNGKPDEGTGGEQPVDIYAGEQRYVYNGQPQGQFGEDLTVAGDPPLATMETLVPGHRLDTISLDGNPETDPGTYPKAIEPSALRIVDASGGDVTENYRIVPESYRPGDLVIDKKGNGNPDPDGGEEPLDIETSDQTYVYNGKPQGSVGDNLPIVGEDPLARATGLIEGHTLKTIAIDGDRQTDAGTYDDALVGRDIRIVDRTGRDVTDKYRIEEESYKPGDLAIRPKGNGVPDGNGGEEPLEVTGSTQTFPYTGSPQGTVGANLPNDPKRPLVAVVTLVPGHSIKTITISGDKQTDEGVYPDTLLPSGAIIVDENGVDVTHNYLLVDKSYDPGTLVIRRSDRMHILTIYHMSEDGRNLKMPATTAVLAGERYAYQSVSITGYTVTKAVIYEGGVSVDNNAPTSNADLLMPDDDVSVIIYYAQNDKTVPTPAPTHTRTPSPGGTTTPRPGGTTTPQPGSTTTPRPGGNTTPHPGGTTTPGGTGPSGPTPRPGGGGSGGSGGGGGNGGGTTTQTPAPAPSPTSSPAGTIQKPESIVDHEIEEHEVALVGDLVKNNGDCAE